MNPIQQVTSRQTLTNLYRGLPSNAKFNFAHIINATEQLGDTFVMKPSGKKGLKIIFNNLDSSGNKSIKGQVQKKVKLILRNLESPTQTMNALTHIEKKAKTIAEKLING